MGDVISFYMFVRFTHNKDTEYMWALSKQRCRVSKRTPILKTRRSYDRLIFIKRIALAGTRGFILSKIWPCFQHYSVNIQNIKTFLNASIIEYRDRVHSKYTCMVYLCLVCGFVFIPVSDRLMNIYPYPSGLLEWYWGNPIRWLPHFR